MVAVVAVGDVVGGEAVVGGDAVVGGTAAGLVGGFDDAAGPVGG